MANLTFTLFCAITVLSIFPTQSRAKLGWNTCLGQPIDSMDLKSANETCQSEMPALFGSGSGPPTRKQLKKSWKNYCFRTCHLKKLGLVTESTDSNLTLVAKRLSAYVESTYPASVRSLINDGLMNCLNQTSMGTPTKSPDREDKKCKSKKPIVKCIDRVLKNNCKPTDSKSHRLSDANNSTGPVTLSSTRSMTDTDDPTTTPRSGRVQAETTSASVMTPDDELEDDEDDEEKV